MLPGYSYSADEFFTSDGAPADIADKRRAGFALMSTTFKSRFEKSIAMTKRAREGISDLQFTGAYRVPFQYSAYLREHLPVGAFVESSAA
jgi:glutamate-1-semialdehyde 2,1-aminomutase